MMQIFIIVFSFVILTVNISVTLYKVIVKVELIWIKFIYIFAIFFNLCDYSCFEQNIGKRDKEGNKWSSEYMSRIKWVKMTTIKINWDIKYSTSLSVVLNGVNEINWIIASNKVSFLSYYQQPSIHNVAITNFEQSYLKSQCLFCLFGNSLSKFKIIHRRF